VLWALACSARADSHQAGDSGRAPDAGTGETRAHDLGGREAAFGDGLGTDLSSSPVGIPFQATYEAVAATSLDFAFEEGDWLEDFGDAAFYGPAFYLRAALVEDRPEYLARADQAHQRNLAVLAKGIDNLGFFLDELEEILMAALGVLEVIGLTQTDEGLEVLDPLIDLVNMTAEGFGTYLDVEMESYALDTYGPTTNTAVIGLLNLRYAQLLDSSPLAGARAAFGEKVLEAIDARAFNGSFYRFRPDDDQLFLYPNISLMIALLTAHQVTGKSEYLERTHQVYEAIQALKDPLKDCYHSPYSAQYMGAETSDYSTLSSQNYTMMALTLLFVATKDESHRQEIGELAGFLRDYLLVDGRLLHHWMDGKVAVPSDPEYFCSGCNLQFLYLALYAGEKVYGANQRGRNDN